MSDRQNGLVMFLLVIFISLALGPASNSGQSRADFYPFHVGDYWEYEEEMWGGLYDVKTRTVLCDSVGADGTVYYKIEERWIAQKDTYAYYEWITDSLEVYRGFPAPPYIRFRLNAEPGDTWDLRLPDEYIKVEAIYDGVVLGISTQLMEFVYYLDVEGDWDIDFSRSILAQGFGVISYGGENFYAKLTGAIINGVRYGTIEYLAVENSSWGRIKGLFR